MSLTAQARYYSGFANFDETLYTQSTQKLCFFSDLWQGLCILLNWILRTIITIVAVVTASNRTFGFCSDCIQCRGLLVVVVVVVVVVVTIVVVIVVVVVVVVVIVTIVVAVIIVVVAAVVLVLVLALQLLL